MLSHLVQSFQLESCQFFALLDSLTAKEPSIFGERLIQLWRKNLLLRPFPTWLDLCTHLHCCLSELLASLIVFPSKCCEQRYKTDVGWLTWFVVCSNRLWAAVKFALNLTYALVPSTSTISFFEQNSAHSRLQSYDRSDSRYLWN